MTHPTTHRQRGIVLVSALLLLIIMTILAMTMFRTNGVQEMIAGNVREKQRALVSAENAEQYAELWLATAGNVLSNSFDCSATGLVQTYSATSTPYICAQALPVIDDAANVTTVPWTVSGNEVGFQFYPGTIGGGSTATGDMTVSTAGGANNYYQVPRYYITLLQSTQNQAMYRINAWNWAGTQNTAAVVESNYVVTCSVCPVTN